MAVRDERDPAACALTAGLTGAQWAWKFLRRNPVYRRDWSTFITNWRELEAAYGDPPHHGFTAWRQDSRAWLRASRCPERNCRVVRDEVLIDCALGAC